MARPALCAICGGRHRAERVGERHARAVALVRRLRAARGALVYLPSRYLVRAARSRGVLLEAFAAVGPRPWWLAKAKALSAIIDDLPPVARRAARAALLASVSVAAGKDPRPAGLLLSR